MRSDDTKDFAIKVERLCDFLIDKYTVEQGRDGSPELKILEDLKDDAADIQAGAHGKSLFLEGLHEAMNGVSAPV